MELALANHSSYPRIGDSPEQQLLRPTVEESIDKMKSLVHVAKRFRN